MEDAFQINTPVGFFVFNRAKHAAVGFSQIAKVKPPVLFLVADGARPDRPGEAELCAEVRQLAEAVDWPCEVRTDFSPVNLGCGKRISSGLNWVFELVEEAIILEDDTRPEPCFFRFCEEMLARYRRSEEHTSEIQSLMRNSYAGFCLKKKKES